MPTAQPDAAVVTLLDAVTSPVALTASSNDDPPHDGNLYKGPLVELDDGADYGENVAVELQQGGYSLRFLGSTIEDKDEYVAVTVRGKFEDLAGSLALARACVTACAYQTVSGYIDCTVVEPQPVFVGQDALGRFLWRFTVRLISAR